MIDFEYEELANLVLGRPEDEPGCDDALMERFGVGLETFASIAAALVPFTITARTALSGKQCRGFVHDGAFIVKEEAPE